MSKTRDAQRSLLLIATMIDGEHVEFLELLEDWNDVLCQGALEVERELLYLCATSEELCEGVRNGGGISLGEV